MKIYRISPRAHPRKVESFFQTATAKAAAGRQRKFLLRLDYVVVVVVRQHHTTQISCVCTAKKRLCCVPSIVHFHHDYRFQRHCLYDGVKWMRKDGVGERPGNATGCCSNDICDLEESKRDEPVCMCFQKDEKRALEKNSSVHPFSVAFSLAQSGKLLLDVVVVCFLQILYPPFLTCVPSSAQIVDTNESLSLLQ